MGDSRKSSVLRKLPLLVGLAGGIGGILPDLDYTYRSLRAQEYSSYYLHHFGWLVVLVFGFGCLAAFNSRQIATLVLMVLDTLSYPLRTLRHIYLSTRRSTRIIMRILPDKTRPASQ